MPLSRARWISSGRRCVGQVERHQRLERRAGRQRGLDAHADTPALASVVVIGGFKFGITIARANCRAECGSTEAIAAPSRRCKCQSSGRAIVNASAIMARLSQSATARLADNLHMNFDDLAKLIPNAAWRLREDDTDPQETREWLDSLDAVIDAVGPERATFVLKHLLQHARTRRVPLPQVLNTPYLNTISLARSAAVSRQPRDRVASECAGAMERAGDGRAGQRGECRARWPYRELFIGRRSLRSRFQSFLSRELRTEIAR